MWKMVHFLWSSQNIWALKMNLQYTQYCFIGNDYSNFFKWETDLNLKNFKLHPSSVFLKREAWNIFCQFSYKTIPNVFAVLNDNLHDRINNSKIEKGRIIFRIETIFVCFFVASISWKFHSSKSDHLTRSKDRLVYILIGLLFAW